MLNKKVFSVILFMLLFVGTVFAVKPAETEWGIQYKMTPKNPEPGDYVSLKIFSYSMDLNSSNITYILNGEYKKGGTGVKNFDFKIPNNNNLINLNITARDFNGKMEKETITIKPVSVDLVYEVVNPYRPLFYKGKSVALSHSKVKFFAFPNFKNSRGRFYDKKTLIYKWSLNGNVLGSKSGIGKDTLYLDKVYGYPRESIVEVEVKSLDKTMKAEKAIILKPGISKIDFYIDEKVMPFRFKSVAKKTLVTNYLDSDIIAIPFFFNDLSNSNINWTINGNKINLLAGSDNLKMNIIWNQENIFSKLKINLEIENEDRVLQAAYNDFIFKPSENLLEKYRKIKKDKQNNNNEDDNFFGL